MLSHETIDEIIQIIKERDSYLLIHTNNANKVLDKVYDSALIIQKLEALKNEPRFGDTNV